MNNPWKLATIGLLALTATLLTSMLTTAYLMRPPAPPTSVPEPQATTGAEPRAPIVRVTPPRREVAAPRSVGSVGRP